MKKILFVLSAAVILLTGCSKSNLDETVTFNVGLAGSVTKATADNDGNAVKANHWVMEVRDVQGSLFYREVKTPAEGTLQETFTVTLIKNQTYNLLFWADNDGGYYNTDDLTAVKLTNPAGYSGNNDARDAFSACKNYKATAGGQISVQLYRPFAQINVITLDLETLWQQAQTTSDPTVTYYKVEPTSFKAKIKVPTQFNVLTQTCGAASTTDVVMTAAESYTGYKLDDNTVSRVLNNYKRHANPATLYMDYLFASKDQKDIIDVAFEFVSNGETVNYNFTSVPVQANYRTNIKGKLLSNETVFNVEILPAWLTPEYEMEPSF